MGADYSFYVKTIETHARGFLALNILAIGRVHSNGGHKKVWCKSCTLVFKSRRSLWGHVWCHKKYFFTIFKGIWMNFSLKLRFSILSHPQWPQNSLIKSFRLMGHPVQFIKVLIVSWLSNDCWLSDKCSMTSWGPSYNQLLPTPKLSLAWFLYS